MMPRTARKARLACGAAAHIPVARGRLVDTLARGGRLVDTLARSGRAGIP